MTTHPETIDGDPITDSVDGNPYTSPQKTTPFLGNRERGKMLLLGIMVGHFVNAFLLMKLNVFGLLALGILPVVLCLLVWRGVAGVRWVLVAMFAWFAVGSSIVFAGSVLNWSVLWYTPFLFFRNIFLPAITAPFYVVSIVILVRSRHVRALRRM